MADARQTVSTAATEAQQCAMKIKHTEDQLKEKRPAAKKIEAEYAQSTKGQKDLEQAAAKIKVGARIARRVVSVLQVELDGLKFNEAAEKSLKTERAALDEKRTALKDTVDQFAHMHHSTALTFRRLQAKLSCMEFSYTDPEKGFDRSKVNGLVAELINVKDANYCTALEITAGGKLFNVVVDSEQTGKQLLGNGKLKRRVTIIPLNKISHKTISGEVIKAAEAEVGKGNVHVALSLVGYEDQVAAAMEFVFGTTLVCKTLDMAKQVTFNDKIRCKSVTLDGDVFDPAGTLTGGSSSASASVLAQLQGLKDAKKELAEVERRLTAVTEELARMGKAAQQFARLKSQYDLKMHEVELFAARIAQSTHHQVQSIETRHACSSLCADACGSAVAGGWAGVQQGCAEGCR